MLFCCLLMLTTSFVFAQTDDVPDYRSKRDNFSKMQEKDVRADVATFTMAGLDESVGKLPLKRIPAVASDKNSMAFDGSDIKVSITSGVFFPTKHKLTKYDEKYVVKIDNKPFYGNYGQEPKRTIEAVTVTVGKDTIAIPPVAYNDLYNPAFAYNANGSQKSFNGVYVSGDGRKIYIYMLSRDENGSYEVTWVIQDKKYLRRVVDFGFLK